MSYCYRILHIADPHFGNCHYTGNPASVGEKHALEVQRVLGEWKRLDRPFHAMVLSGDLSFACQSDGFIAAEAFIQKFMGFKTSKGGKALVNPAGLFVIPGNHDVNLGARVVIDKLSLSPPKEIAEAEFRKFLASVHTHIGPPNHWLTMTKRISVGKSRGLVIMALNSSRAERLDAQGWGYVGMDQIHQAASLLLTPSPGKNGAQNEDVVLAVTHHNPLPIWDVGLETLNRIPSDRKLSFMMDTGSTLNFLAEIGTSVILHGHTHIQSVMSVDGYGSEAGLRDKPILVLGCGSLSINFDGVTPPLPLHHFQIVEIEEGEKKQAPYLSYQDFRCVFRAQNMERAWTSGESVGSRVISTTWNPDIVEKALKQKEHESNLAARASEVMESWSVLGIKKLRPQDWLNTMEDLYLRVRPYLRVRNMDSGVGKDKMIVVIEKLFKHPPSEDTMCRMTLEYYLADVIARSNGIR